MATMFPTRNAVDASARAMLVDQLNLILADFSDAYAQCKHAHWNVQGEDFFMWHKLFDEVAGFVDHADTVAERIGALGGFATGTLRMAARASRLPECPETCVNGEELIAHINSCFATLSRNLRTTIMMCEDQCEDEVTGNILQEMCADVEKGMYFLERHMYGGS